MGVNLEAASEVARQLRLRDMGGIIVIDFIDMNLGVNRRNLYEKLKDEMKRDRAKHSILPPSKFGLVQITRQRVRPEMSVQILEKCPTCDGTGEIRPSVLLIDDIENNISYLIREQNEKSLNCLFTLIFMLFSQRMFSTINGNGSSATNQWITVGKAKDHIIYSNIIFLIKLATRSKCDKIAQFKIVNI